MPIEQTEKQNKEEKLSFGDKIGLLLHKYRVVFLGLGIAVAVAFASLLVFTLVSNKLLYESTRALEEIERSFEALSEEKDETVKARKEGEVISAIESLVQKRSGSYAAQKALLVKAQIFYDKKEWAKAEESYKTLAETYPKSYLGPIALTSAAACAEERGDIDTSISFYTQFIKDYEKKAVGTPHALFSLGRLNEEKKDYAAAKTNYERLAELYPDDNWTKFGKSRIILLKSQGLIQ
jgi:tetratricopeptide (TPR) repeat protein